PSLRLLTCFLFETSRLPFFFYRSAPPRHLHSFPTRRSSDLIQRLGRIIRRKDDGRHGRFVVLYAINTIEDETRNRDQQFGAVVLSARRIADFTETQIRELRKFLMGPVPEAPIAPRAAPGTRS